MSRLVESHRHSAIGQAAAFSRGRAAAARRAHNPEVAGSIPALATVSSMPGLMPGFAGPLSRPGRGTGFFIRFRLAGPAKRLPIVSLQCALKPPLAPPAFGPGASLFGWLVMVFMWPVYFFVRLVSFQQFPNDLEAV